MKGEIIKEDYGPIPDLDKQIALSPNLEDIQAMILKACGIRSLIIPILKGESRIVVDLLFHKKRKVICRKENKRFINPKFYD